jgi:hypothetical protein
MEERETVATVLEPKLRRDVEATERCARRVDRETKAPACTLRALADAREW